MRSASPSYWSMAPSSCWASPCFTRSGPRRRPEGARRARQSAQDHGQPEPACLHDVRIIDKQGRIVCIEHILRLPASVVLIGTVAATAKGEVTETSTPAPGRSPTGAPPPPSSIPCWNSSRSTSPSSAVSPCSGFAASSSFPTPSISPGEPPKGAVRASDFQDWVDEVMKMDGTISSATEQAWPAITAMVASAHARIEQARARGLVGGGDQKSGNKRRRKSPAPVTARAR